MMKDALELWIKEIRRFNARLHLVGPGLLCDLRAEVQACLPLLAHIQAPVIADLGSGSGLPGIPYALSHPQARVYLIERSSDKCVFLRHMVDLLGLSQVAVLETDPLKHDPGIYAAVIARAFSPKRDLNRAARRILEPKGRFYALGTQAPLLDISFEPRGVLAAPEAPDIKLFEYVLNQK